MSLRTVVRQLMPLAVFRAAETQAASTAAVGLGVPFGVHPEMVSVEFTSDAVTRV